ncbi:MAG: ATP-binding protein [Roseburia sp.]|nr:ATP-binding protein [Roseburia sp.]
MKKFWKKKWNVVLYFVLAGISILFIYMASQSGEQYRFERYESLKFELPWNYQFSDGTKGITDLPTDLEVEDAQQLVLTNTLPAVDTGMSLFYRARHTNAKIYIGDELVYDQGEGKDGAINETAFPLPGTVWDEVHLTKEDSHKQVKIVLDGNVLKYLKAPGEVFIGDRGTFFVNLLKEKMGNIIGGTILLLLSAILLALWIVLSISTHAKYNECLCLALFTFTIACWQFTETRCLQFIFPNQRMFSVLAFEFLTLAPVPIALYFTYGKREKTRKRARIAAIVPLFVWLFNNACHFLHIFDISETLIVTQIMIAFETIYLGYIQTCDLIVDKRSNGKEGGGFFWWIPSVGFILLSPLLLMEVLKYITNFTLKFNDDTILPTIGIVFYITSLAIHSGLKLASENFMVTEASRAKSNFLANTSHDIRTPLNAILGFNDLILRDSEEEKTKEYAASIKNAGNSLLDIINNILDLSKLESGKLELEEAEYSTEQAIDNVTSMIRALAQKKNLTLDVVIDEKLPKYLIGDKVRIRQVLVNLLTNAVKYTKEGGVKLEVKVVEKNEASCKILFVVEDTGIGIREEDRERLFKKFERLDSEKNRNIEGTGLGMSIVVKLLESMNSKIELESVYGKGSKFYFVLEQKMADDACVGVYLQKKKLLFEQEEENILIAPDARVLIVDDVMLNLQVAKGLLEVMKMQIDTAESGQEAIDLTLQNHYDLILMDHMMPGMDGIAATREIRKLADTTGDSYYKKVPILALTANALSGMREKFLQEGMQDYISKPVEEKTLVDAVTKWLPQEKLIPKKMGW